MGLRTTRGYLSQRPEDARIDSSDWGRACIADRGGGRFGAAGGPGCADQCCGSVCARNSGSKIRLARPSFAGSSLRQTPARGQPVSVAVKMAHGLATRSRLQSLALVVIGMASLYFLRDVFIPIALALLLAFLLGPITDQLRKLRLGKVVATLITLVVVFGALGLLTSLVVRELMDVARGLPNYEQGIHKRVEEMSSASAVASLTRGIQAVTRGLSNTNSKPGKAAGAFCSRASPRGQSPYPG